MPVLFHGCHSSCCFCLNCGILHKLTHGTPSRVHIRSGQRLKFDVWCNLYEDMIANDGSTLEDTARARLIVYKQEAATYARFSNHILSKKTLDNSLDETVKTHKEQHIRFRPSLHLPSNTAQRQNYPRLHPTCQSVSRDGQIQLRHARTNEAYRMDLWPGPSIRC
ncbi:hypothetical protein ANCDUO_09124 [Ancylostoma duodenale]|uniref:DUF7083 domain-containing protein n=1 Tax=Ancylostoma duodenale TaxID=51022 RepID=A0A0C2DDS8_9BILA|nr:hypothetical protein ANCDUO_09124 [Ancylostoma duodenale]